LQDACVHLTEGQYLDLKFETEDEVKIDEYERMIQGKTSALISAATRIGARLGARDLQREKLFEEFGRQIGLAFQMRDDFLGIWGDQPVTGKSASSDLISKKKTLPVLFAIENSAKFGALWREVSISESNINEFVRLMDETGSREFTQTRVLEHTSFALQALDSANPEGEAGEILYELADSMKNRVL
jgi:geranylgeranyl diphosphate synthase type I